jgi:hypothetical protein
MKAWRKAAQGRAAKRKCEHYADQSNLRKAYVKRLKKIHRGYIGAWAEIQARIITYI